MQVLHRQHQGPTLTGVQDDLPQQGKGLHPALLGADVRQGCHLSWDVQELEEQGHTIVRDDPSRVQLLLDGGGDGVKGGRVGQVPELPQQVVHWQIGGGAAIGETVTFAVRHRLPAKLWANSASSRDLPMPGSPTRPTACPCLLAASASRSCSSASSRARPTKRLRGRALRRGTPARRRRRPCTTYPATGMAVASLVRPPTPRPVLRPVRAHRWRR